MVLSTFNEVGNRSVLIVHRFAVLAEPNDEDNYADEGNKA